MKSKKNNIQKLILIIILLIFAVAVSKPFFVVDETEQVVITQFGKPIGEAITDPGLHFKVPFIQVANYFRKNLLEWDGDPGQIPTFDKTFIVIDSFARWRIKDPLQFYKSVYDERGAQKRLDDILDATTYDFITSNNLIEVVRSTNRIMTHEQMLEEATTIPETLPEKLPEAESEIKPPGEKGAQFQIELGREKMTRGILEEASPKLDDLGIELIDFRIKRVNYVEEVRNKVYERMIAERKQMSQKYRSEGMGETRKVEGEKEKELQRIRSEAYRTSEGLKGKADGEATKIYADAYGKDPGFFSFYMTLNSYSDAFDNNTSAVLSTESDFLKYLKDFSK